MGVIAKGITNRRTEPIQAPLGPWEPAAARVVPELGREDLLWLAVLSAALAVPVGGAESCWLSGQGKVPESRRDSASVRSLLRCEGGRGGPPAVSLGAAHLGQFVADWALSVDPRIAGGAVIDVPQYRTWDGKLPNFGVLDTLRASIIAALAQGPRLDITEGVPSFDGMVARSTLRKTSFMHFDESPFAHDYLTPIPAWFANGACIDIPADSVGEVAAAFDELSATAPGAGPVARVRSLSAGRPGNRSRILLFGMPEAPRLELDLPAFEGSSAVGRQRTFRAALAFLQTCAARVTGTAARSSISQFVEACAGPFGAPDRIERFEHAWSPEVASDVMPVGSGSRVPVALLMRSKVARTLLDLAAEAQSWTVVRDRTWAAGFRQSKRDATRVFQTRRAAFVADAEGRVHPWLRYAHVAESPIDQPASCSSADSWFWECRLGDAPQGHDGRAEQRVLLSGLSHTDSLVGYGTELLTFLRALAWLVEDADLSASIRTVWLTVP